MMITPMFSLLDPRLAYSIQLAEMKQLETLLSLYYGRELLQLGLYPSNYLYASPILHKFVLGEDALRQKFRTSFGYASYTELPLPTESIKLVVLPHLLEILEKEKIQAALKEAWRVLDPNGRLIIVGVNPMSLLGVYKWLEPSAFPTKSAIFSPLEVKQWLRFFQADVQMSQTFLYQPFITSKSLLKLLPTEKMISYFFPFAGCIYLIVAQKKATTFTPLKSLRSVPSSVSSRYKTLIPTARNLHKLL